MGRIFETTGLLVVVASVLACAPGCASSSGVETRGPEIESASAVATEADARVASSLVSAAPAGKMFLVPTTEAARLGCRAEVARYYCEAGETRAAVGRCLEGLDGAARAACGADGRGCLREETYAESCAASGAVSGLVYPSAAACAAPRPRTCSFYDACLEPVARCGEAGYALGFGEKYCTASANMTGLTEEGSAWRYSVMDCLQASLAPFAAAKPGTVSCETVVDTAFASHPRCYTQPEHSICFLPPSDVLAILRTIGGRELLAARTQKQILQTARACLGQIGRAIVERGTPTATDDGPGAAPTTGSSAAAGVGRGFGTRALRAAKDQGTSRLAAGASLRSLDELRASLATWRDVAASQDDGADDADEARSSSEAPDVDEARE